MTEMLCQVYRSPRREGMYLYTRYGADLGELPEALLAQFGEPQPALVLKLHSERKLASAQAPQVLAQIEAAGFYLQMPPPVFNSPNEDHA